MTDKIQHATDQVVGSIESGIHRIHGAGDAIRGTAMEALDKVLHSREGEERDREIAERGRAEMETAGEWERDGSRSKLQARRRSTSRSSAGVGEGSHLAQSRIRGAEDASNLSSPEEEMKKTDTTIGSQKGDGLKAARLAMKE
ncbi:uncharacterized protein PV06_01781 [Exophiala oligosperma]|uniref:Uncharacterized protein n=1 Tax=Exophiala oligosperma TaxID=215243 RepID=A0A0D2B1Q9_9EURO|nr:uncharacterized protein PV06_01781 [Exophiala oligosperma]KIW46091.1 hypothetical protein PV06_01781 [Exophiala oligosperma]